MNHRERIEHVARLEPTDRFPFALLSSGAWAINKNGVTLEEALKLPTQQIADWLYEGYTQSDSDISWVGSGYNNIVIKAVGGKIKWRRKGTPDVVEPLLNDISDIDQIDPNQLREDPDIQIMYEVTKLLVEKEQGERLVGASMWGPFTLLGLLYGADSLMRSVYKDPATAHKLLQFSTELYLAYIQGYIDSGAKVIFMAEPSASGDMISRNHFESIALPYIKQIYVRLSTQYPDLILGLHICGNTTNLLDLIADSGAQIMSLDYKVDLIDAKNAFDGKIAFSGNLDPVSIVLNGTDEEIRNKTIEDINKVGANHNYIVMPGCDIPPTTPLEHLQTISATVRAYDILSA